MNMSVKKGIEYKELEHAPATGYCFKFNLC